MLIVVEGPTAAGKSTLVKGLHERLGFPVVHMPAEETSDPENHYIAAATHGWLVATGSGRIMDRWVYSNQVYSRLLFNQPMADLEKVEQEILDFFPKVCTIWLTGMPEVLYQRALDRGRPLLPGLYNLDTWESMVRRFDDEFNTCRLPKIQLNSEILTPDQLLSASLGFIEGTRAHGEDENYTCRFGD